MTRMVLRVVLGVSLPALLATTSLHAQTAAINDIKGKIFDAKMALQQFAAGLRHCSENWPLLKQMWRYHRHHYQHWQRSNLGQVSLNSLKKKVERLKRKRGRICFLLLMRFFETVLRVFPVGFSTSTHTGKKSVPTLLLFSFVGNR